MTWFDLMILKGWRIHKFCQDLSYRSSRLNGPSRSTGGVRNGAMGKPLASERPLIFVILPNLDGSMDVAKLVMWPSLGSWRASRFS
jgi:hypothetical protein